MRSSPSFVWLLVFLVVVVLILQVVHFVIFSCLEMKKSEKMKPIDKITPPLREQKHLSYFRLDMRGSYQVYHSVVDGTKNSPPQKNSVTMVTHCSSQSMHYLPTLVERWKGPISLAVFTSNDDFHVTFSAIHSFVGCYPDLEKRVQFHLVLPLDNVDKIRSLNFTHKTNVPCNKLTSYLNNHIKSMNYALRGIPYPNNLLRNVGRLRATTNFVLVNDIDILPNQGLYEQTLQFFKSQSLVDDIKTTAFVLPVFEVEESKQVPQDKSELITAVDDGTVRQFYVEPCYRCQSPTDYDKWIATEVSGNSLHVAYTVEYQPLWEPFVITHKRAPLYDERFKQYGYNRISNICELNLAGFTFAVLDSGYLVHQGFKRKESFHSSKDDENAANRELFQNVLEEFQSKYQESGRTCRAPT